MVHKFANFDKLSKYVNDRNGCKAIQPIEEANINLLPEFFHPHNPLVGMSFDFVQIYFNKASK